MGFYKAEYIWIDGSSPTSKLRSKTKIIPENQDPPEWGFDGSSTMQAVGSNSDCVLNPVFNVMDPIRGKPNRLVLCQVYLPDGSPHSTNTRILCEETANKFAGYETIFGIEQEYTFFSNSRPLGWPSN